MPLNTEIEINTTEIIADLGIVTTESNVNSISINNGTKAYPDQNKNINLTINGQTVQAIGNLETALNSKSNATNIENGTGVGSIKSSNLNDDDRPYTQDELPVASGHEAIAFGKKCKATGKRSFAMGNGNESTGNCAFTAGQLNKNAGNGTLVTGLENIVISDTTEAEEWRSDYSLISGFSNYNRSRRNVNVGVGNVCMKAEQANAIGCKINNTVPNSLKIGIFNNNKGQCLFEVGNGTADNTRSNAFEVYNDGHAEMQTMGNTNNSIVNKSYADTKEASANKTTSVNSSSTDTQYPSAKATYNAIQSATEVATTAEIESLIL